MSSTTTSSDIAQFAGQIQPTTPTFLSGRLGRLNRKRP